jgi:predicted phosphodiesterase
VKIAVLSDIHGNVPALEAVLDDIERWRPDEVIVNGDVVSRGPYSLACLRLLQARLPDSRLLTGNHETYVLACVDRPPTPDEPTYDISRFAQWTASQLGAAVDELRGWGDHVDLAGLEGDSSVHVTHGSRLGNRSGITPETSDDDLAKKLGDPRALFIGSHTHRPLIREFNGKLVVNTGSVGQPFDGDARAAYGRFMFARGQWQAEIARLAYDKPRAERDFADSGFLDECGPLARMILRELRECRMLVGPWMGRYLEPIKAREVTVAEAVEEYLLSL